MNRLRLNRAATALMCLFLWAFAGCSPSSVEIRQRGEAYEITVSPSNVVLILPQGDWAPSKVAKDGAATSPTYFALEDGKGLMLSGWLEPAERYSGLKPLWEGDCKAWKEHGAPEPLNVTFTKIGDWDAVLYELSMPQRGASNTHIRAEWAGQGTWIDAHMSLTSTLGIADARKRIHEVFDGVRVKSKKPS